jgi:hypothetical protein
LRPGDAESAAEISLMRAIIRARAASCKPYRGRLLAPGPLLIQPIGPPLHECFERPA